MLGRLLVLCDTVDADGGTESYLSRVLPALRDAGFHVRIAARRVIDPGAFGDTAEALGWSADDAPPSASAAGAVGRLIDTWRPDVVMTSNVHDPLTMTAARAAPRLVVRVHDHRLFCPQGDRQYPHFPTLCTQAMKPSTCLSAAVMRGCVAGLSTRTLRLVRAREALRNAVLLADRVVVSSQFMADLCAINGVSQQRLTIVAPPFAGDISRAPRPTHDSVLFAGRLVRDKGLASLVRALARIPSARRPPLSVAGSMTSELRSAPALAARLGVAMTLLGKLDTSRLHAAIDAAAIVAVPSLWPEPFGLMGIEAFARGRPVVAYEVGGISAWMGSAGILVPRADERAFAAAIATALEPANWRRFSDAAIRQAENYLVGAHAAALTRVLLPAELRPTAPALGMPSA